MESPLSITRRPSGINRKSAIHTILNQAMIAEIRRKARRFSKMVLLLDLPHLRA